MDQSQFVTLHEQAVAIVKRIKQRNDVISRGSAGTEAKLIQEINQDKDFFGKQVHRLNSIIHQLEGSYVDPQTAKKLEILKKEAKKQINRNEYLIKQLIKNTYDDISQSQSIGSQRNMNQIEMTQAQRKSGSRDLMVVHQGQSLEHELSQQKTKLLKDFQKTITQVHGILKETESMVSQQGDQLDLISQDLQSTKENAKSASSNIKSANDYQKSSTSKTLLIVLLMVILVAVLVIILILT